MQPEGIFLKKIKTYNYFHNILRFFDVLTNFPFTTREVMCGCFLQTWYIRVAKRLETKYQESV